MTSLPLKSTNLQIAQHPLVVLLVTPLHIGLLDDGNNFIPTLLRQTAEPSMPQQGLDVLAAVVDRIPYPNHSTKAERQLLEPAENDSAFRSRREDGSEGISVAVLDSDLAAPKLWSSREEPTKRETMSIQQRCTLSFSFPPLPVEISTPCDDPEFRPLVSRTLQLPIANTIFQNGKTSTLFAQRWISRRVADSDRRFFQSKHSWLPSQKLNMEGLFAQQDLPLETEHCLHSHLVPITPSRTIVAAVGNIIRRISVDEASERVAPASEELEKAIAIAIQDGQIPAQQAGVWALIRPKAHHSILQDDQSEKHASSIIQHAIFSGGRLHKVLSGGGGWGEKHGLLALDPDSDYSRKLQAFEPSFEDDQDVEAEKREALGEVAAPGDTVIFLVYKSPIDVEAANDLNRETEPLNKSTPISVAFGALPSTMDAMPAAAAKEETAAESKSSMVNNHFGMLSEQGMSLEVSTLESRKFNGTDSVLKSVFMKPDRVAGETEYSSPELRQERSQSSAKNLVEVVTTKLDSPYTLLSINGGTYRPIIGHRNDRQDLELPAPNSQGSTVLGLEGISAIRGAITNELQATSAGFLVSPEDNSTGKHVRGSKYSSSQSSEHSETVPRPNNTSKALDHLLRHWDNEFAIIHNSGRLRVIKASELQQYLKSWDRMAPEEVGRFLDAASGQLTEKDIPEALRGRMQNDGIDVPLTRRLLTAKKLEASITEVLRKKERANEKKIKKFEAEEKARQRKHNRQGGEAQLSGVNDIQLSTRIGRNHTARDIDGSPNLEQGANQAMANEIKNKFPTSGKSAELTTPREVKHEGDIRRELEREERKRVLELEMHDLCGPIQVQRQVGDENLKVVRFITNRPTTEVPYRQVTLGPETHVRPSSVRKHFSAGAEAFYQKHEERMKQSAPTGPERTPDNNLSPPNLTNFQRKYKNHPNRAVRLRTVKAPDGSVILASSPHGTPLIKKFVALGYSSVFSTRDTLDRLFKIRKYQGFGSLDKAEEQIRERGFPIRKHQISSTPDEADSYEDD